MKEALTFDDVALVPQYNNVESRTGIEGPDVKSFICKDIYVDVPVVPANMESVINEDLADVMIKRRGVPIFHRFMDNSRRMELLDKYGFKAFMSFGIKDVDKADELIDRDQGFLRYVCIDVAHGHDKRVLNSVYGLKHRWGETIQILTGNICTPVAVQDMFNAGADAVKVGIGPGAACTTRMVTGFGVPQFTALVDCCKLANKLRIPVMADGGIRNSRDVALAVAAGATSVMIGKLFAQTFEAEGNGIYRGQASREFQMSHYGEMKTVPEGEAMSVEREISADVLLDRLLGGLKNAMTYGGAKNIKEFQRKAEFVRVTPSYMGESGVRREWNEV